jgi:acyl dehydratase
MTLPTIPADVRSWIGQERNRYTANFPVERGYLWTSCASVENGNPLFWDDNVAAELTDGPIAPPTTLSLWFRPHHWEPGAEEPRLPLQTHFDLKERLQLPEAVMTDSVVVFHAPVRPGDVVSTSEVLRSISDPKTTKLGTGRFWVIDVSYRNQHGSLVGVETFTGFGYRRGDVPPPSTEATFVTAAVPGVEARKRPQFRALADVNVGETLPPLHHDVTATTVVLGALATRDWRPMHHDVDFAVNRNGTRDIFLNTPNQQAWFERYVTDWTGPRGRLGRMRFRMRDPVFPGDRMTFIGTVDEVTTDETGCGWAKLAIELHACEVTGHNIAPTRLCTTCAVRVALPTDPDDNPWSRRGDLWHP